MIELLRELLKKKTSGRLSMVAFSPPWVCKKTPLLSRLVALNENAHEKFLRQLH